MILSGFWILTVKRRKQNECTANWRSSPRSLGDLLAERARRRGFDAQIQYVGVGDAIPDDLDIYTLGGGEDAAQELAVETFTADPGLKNAVAAGRPLLAICASLQILGHWYTDARNRKVEGLGLLDLTTRPQGKRSIGELVVQPEIDGLSEPLTGFENHGGGSQLGPDARPLGKVLFGKGNSILPPEGVEASSSSDETALKAPRIDGAVQGSIIATYLHGPVLARNPQLADLLLERALGHKLEPLEVPGVAELRRERLAATISRPELRERLERHER